jgi:hypothetical protein
MYYLSVYTLRYDEVRSMQCNCYDRHADTEQPDDRLSG